MKVLLLNPHRDAMHEIVEVFRGRGVAVLSPSDTEDAWQMLNVHGQSVDLAIVHREWGAKGKDLGLKFVERFRADPVQGDLPFILTTESWTPADCAQHQSVAGSVGANAYLQWPFNGEQLYDLVRQVIPETSTSINRPIPGEAELPPLATPPSQTSPMAPMVAEPPADPAASAPPLFPLPTGSDPPPLSFELAPVNSEAGTGFTVAGTDGLSIGGVPAAFEFTNGTRANPVVPPPFHGPQSPPAVDSTGLTAPVPFDVGEAMAATAGVGIATGAAGDPGLTIGTDTGAGPAISFPASPIAAADSMVLEDASSLISGPGHGSGNSQSSISLLMPSMEELSGPTIAQAPQQGTSVTTALPSPSPFAPNESTRQLSANEPPMAPFAAGGTVTMMAPPVAPKPSTKGRDSFDEGVASFAIGEVTPPAPAKPSSGGPSAADIAAASVDLNSDREVQEKMPYLFGAGIGPAMTGILKAPPAPITRSVPIHFDHAMGDAVVPGGAAQSPDSDTLKKYLMLREQDVAVLSTQLKTIQDQLSATADQVRAERQRAVELGHQVSEQNRRIADFEREKTAALDSLQGDLEDLRFQVKTRNDKAKQLESRLRESTEETERLKERVRSDIRKIRVHEKELENRLEILKKDSEALIAARETKIIELKRKVDLLEFNMDLLQNQYQREKEGSVKLRDRLAKAAQIVRVAGGLLDSEGKAALEQLTSIDTEREAS